MKMVNQWSLQTFFTVHTYVFIIAIKANLGIEKMKINLSASCVGGVQLVNACISLSWLECELGYTYTHIFYCYMLYIYLEY